MARKKTRDDVAPKTTNDEVPIEAETLTAGMIQLMQLAYAYQAKDASRPQDSRARRILNDAVSAAAAHRRDLIARHREAMAASQLTYLTGQVDAARTQRGAKRRETQRHIARILVDLIGAGEVEAERASERAVDEGLIHRLEGPAGATAKIVAEAIGCSARQLTTLRQEKASVVFAPFGPYPIQTDDPRLGTSEGNVFVRGAARSLLRYVLDLVDWPGTREERDELASGLDAKRRFSRPGNVLEGLLKFDTPVVAGRDLPNRVSQTAGGRASAKRSHDAANAYVGKSASGKPRKPPRSDDAPASKKTSGKH